MIIPFKNLFFVFFALSIYKLINSYQPENNWVETVEKYTAVWAQMADPTSDWLKRHKKIGKNFAKFLKLSGPISSLVAAGLDTAFQPESDEFIAISKLNTDVIKGFQKVSEELQSIGNRVFHRMNMIDYRNNVVFTMMNLQEIVDIATQPSPDFQIKGKLKETCIGKDGPMLTLMRIKEMTYANCEWPSLYTEKLLNRAIDLFWRLDYWIPNEKKFGSFLSNYNAKKQGHVTNFWIC